MFLDFLSLQVLDTEKANFVWKRVSKLLCKLEVQNKQHINSWSVRRGRMIYTTFATVPCYYHLDLFSDILTKTWATVNFSISSSIKLAPAGNLHFFFLESEYCLRYGKKGNKKRATCFASLLQNGLNSGVARYTAHIKPVLQQIRSGC